MKGGFTEGELWILVRQERALLLKERPALAARLREIDARLEELNKAEDLLENGL